MSEKLNHLFDQIRQKNLKEDFEIGQAAQALFELQKSSKAFNSFLNGSFKESFKKMHNDPRLIEDGHYELLKLLEEQEKELVSVIQEMKTYIMDMGMYINPESINKDKHRNNRWTRWEHRTPRNIQKAQDKEDGY